MFFQHVFLAFKISVKACSSPDFALNNISLKFIHFHLQAILLVFSLYVNAPTGHTLIPPQALAWSHILWFIIAGIIYSPFIILREQLSSKNYLFE